MNSTRIILPDNNCCAFCDYLNGVRPFSILHRDDLVAVLITREQRGDPHLLVIPVRHVPTIIEVNSDELAQIGIALRQVTKAIVKSYNKKGVSIWQNNGISASQSIAHLHFHIAGTLDNGGTNWGDVPELTLSETDIICDRIKLAFTIK
ncbi:HIT family protein [Acerihabitans arboris]|uniref:HIT domain-containing protein n=1 Tax=Acerihabitans arboris TaxID=2691583 RepID=A0A845SM08_9GAMM|nr:HIT domain-containing protein [Acerihabitans arboris]NDL64257.1 HIT domain-containing protein [Acerihabitans arboris]